jgi:hypothetical protein
MSTSTFTRPNKTKSLFSQIDANRPAAARTKLGGIEASQSVLQNQTAVQGQENKNVQGQQQQMITAGQQGRDSTSNLAGFGKAQAVFAEGNPQVAGGVPKFQDAFKSNEVAQTKASIVGPSNPNEIVAGPNSPNGNFGDGAMSYFNRPGMAIGGPVTPGGQNAKQGYGLDSGQSAVGIGNQINTRTTQKEGEIVRNADGTLSRIGEIKLGDELSTAYGDASKTLEGYQNKITEGNLGAMANESDYEMEQAKLAQVLADRQSNVGKLKALYGVGYDTNKYGALDSNLLQGQFNAAAETAKENIAAKDMAQKEGGRVREAYLDENKAQVGKLDETKAATEKRVVETDKKLSTLKQQLSDLKTNTSNAANAARNKLNAEIEKLETDRKASIKKLEGEVSKKRSRNELAGKIGINDKDAQGLNDYQVTLVQKVLSGVGLTGDERKGIDEKILAKAYKSQGWDLEEANKKSANSSTQKKSKASQFGGWVKENFVDKG